jgi:rhodanese-related sulfurtransferase
MFISGFLIFIVVVCLVAGLRVWQRKSERELDRHSITPDELHSLLSSKQKVELFDVRQPLDLLAYPEMIPGAQRVTPEEVLNEPSRIPRDKDVVVYCTCVGEKTSRALLHRALGLHFVRIKFLRGGLAGWKAKGFPVEPYRGSFQLHVPSTSPHAG